MSENARWWGPCERCGKRSDFLGYEPGTKLKVCAGCYEQSLERDEATSGDYARSEVRNRTSAVEGAQ